jgi:hypothetical protein
MKLHAKKGAIRKPRLKKCDICGTQFEPTKSHQRRCSAECTRQKNLQTSQEYYAMKRGVVGKKPCRCCQVEFQPNRHNQFYCSSQCRDKQKRLREAGQSGTSARRFQSVRELRKLSNPVPTDASRQAVAGSRSDVDRALKRVGLA